MPDHWEQMFNGLDALRADVGRPRVQTTAPDPLPLADVRSQLIAIEAAIGAIGASLGRIVVQVGEIRAMLDE